MQEPRGLSWPNWRMASKNGKPSMSPTVLVAGALATIVYTVSSLFTVPRDTVPALIYAGTGIIGMVLLAGGIFLVHRKDADAFFTR